MDFTCKLKKGKERVRDEKKRKREEEEEGGYDFGL